MLNYQTNIGNLYVIAAPSGTGKTSLVNALVDTLQDIRASVSHTTRPRRANEMQSVHYYFIDKAEFESMIQHQDFFEYATIFDYYYGTSKRWVQETLAQGVDVILEIDWQGHQQIKHLFPQSVGIFILPPSLLALQSRLMKRNQDRPDIIKKRLADVQETVSHVHEFDYVIMNDDFDRALNDLTFIIEAGRLLQRRQANRFSQLIQELLSFSSHPH